jgi:nitrite reductase (NADH) large subunit
MLEAARTCKHAVVIGGGLLGLEAASGLRKQGLEVTVVHACDVLMERQLDAAAGLYLRKQLEKSGIHFLMPRITQCLLADSVNPERVAGLQFEDGSSIPAQLVVMAVGIRPNIELARKSGLYCERGIVVDDTLQTYDPSIYAVGECAQHKDMIYGLVAPLYDQAKVCASHLAGHGIKTYYGSLLSTRLKVTGIEMFSAGDFNAKQDSNTVTCEDPATGVYRKLVLKDNRIQGVILYGDVRDSGWYFELMESGENIGTMREHLIFGRQFTAAPVSATVTETSRSVLAA